MAVAEFSDGDFKYVLGVLCNYDDLPHGGVRTKVLCFFLFEGRSNLSFVERNAGGGGV